MTGVLFLVILTVLLALLLPGSLCPVVRVRADTWGDKDTISVRRQIDIQLALTNSKELGKKLGRFLLDDSILVDSDLFALVVDDLLRLKELVKLANQAKIIKTACTEHFLEFRFFFTRWNILLPSSAADSRVIGRFGLETSRYASV